jgi:superfamily I DNA and/or RNA helicase
MELNIGVITPYSKQRNKIKGMLQHCGLQDIVTVNTIDGYQGKERDVIIMSCVRTQGTGFMSDAQRLNVSLTRARFSMIICANFQSLEVSFLQGPDSQ